VKGFENIRNSPLDSWIIKQIVMISNNNNNNKQNADLFAESEEYLTAIQDQVILRRNYKKYILKQPDTDELCRRCGEESETIQHITAACE